jgi:RNA polymerase sigma factor (sigma-70 family)
MSEFVATEERMTGEQDRRVYEALERERPRLRNWIRRRLADPSEVEDVLQDVFFELVQVDQLLSPIEDVGAWLYRVARNRITDLFRKKKPEALADQVIASNAGEALALEDLLPSREASPEAIYARGILVEELADSLEALPAEQREVFLAHEIEGLSFREISALTGTSVNTLISRKRYAVLQLRRRLQVIYEEFGDE